MHLFYQSFDAKLRNLHLNTHIPCPDAVWSLLLAG